MDELDLRIRNEVYSSFVRSGITPAAGEVAAALGLEHDEVAAALRRLHDAHALVLAAGRHRGPDAESVLGRRDDLPGRSRRSLVVRELRLGRARHPRGAARRRPDRRRLPRLRRSARARGLATASSSAAPSCSSTSSCRPAAGGTTLPSPEARWSSSGRRSTWSAGSTANRWEPGASMSASKAERAGAELVVEPGSIRTGVPAHVEGVAGDPRRARTDRFVLAARLAVVPVLVDVDVDAVVALDRAGGRGEVDEGLVVTVARPAGGVDGD